MPLPWKHMECAPKCRSKRHAYSLHSAITKGSFAEVQSYFSLCYAAGKVNDIHGRSALHMAASCGKLELLEWLLEEKKSDLAQKDAESGWTALHRAMFYGQLGATRLLIQYKSDLYTKDREGLGPLDLAMKDRQLVKSVPKPVYSQNDRHEVYTWGNNANFTLGQVTEHRLQTPDVVDEFRKRNIDLKKIVMCKFHTVFITKEGLVYTCGQGHGGRLGHPTEDICVVPKLVEAMKNEVCVDAAASRNHTLLLTDSGAVYSCGLNDYQQLGQNPVQEKCLLPRQVNSRMLKGKTVKGFCTGRFHSVVYTAHAVFTCGLNAGQLGHLQTIKGSRTVAAFKQVSALNISSISIVMVVCSDAATVIYTTTGEIFVLHEYQCRRITSNRTDVAQLYVIGGNLDYTDTQNLRENGGRELIISYLNQSGKVFVWRESSPSFKKINFSIKRQLYIEDCVLTITSLAVVTDSGEVFVCTLSNNPPPVREPIRSNKESKEGEFGRVTLMDLVMQEETEDVQVKKVINVHRAMYITADRKGHNYATLQSLPNSSLTDVPVISSSDMREDFSRLLDEADEYDLIHDVILEAKGQRWPAHKYILVSRCSNFHSLYPKCVQSHDSDNIPIVKITDIHPQIFEQLIMYIYTDMCDLLSIGAKFKLSKHQMSSSFVKEDIFQMDMGVELEEDIVDYHAVSAFQVTEQNKKKKSKEGKKKGNQGKSSVDDKNPVKMLLEAGKRWGVTGLAKRLECVSYQNGYIFSTDKPTPRSSLHFDRNKMEDTKLELYDVSLKSDDGVLFPCHRCILVARLEYFHSMLATGWMETSTSKPLTLPVQSDILEILLNFLYTDDSTVVQRTQNVEYLCNILVVADQLLIVRLKEMCETSIAALITLKNVGELLEFASTYNAGQLRSTCQQFIVLNLTTLLENRSLDILSEDVVDELTAYYRQSIENMSRRMITPYDESPEKEFLESLVETEEPLSLPAAIDNKKAKPKKKRIRTKSGAEDRKKILEKGLSPEKGSRRLSERQMSVSSDISVKSDEEAMEDMISDAGHKAKPAVKQLQINVTDSRARNENSNSIQQPMMLSPNSPREPGKTTGCLSLRDIMEEEQSERGRIKSANLQKSGRISWKDVKRQQRDQLKVTATTKEDDNAETEVKSPGICPWGSVNKTVQSFRSLMIEEQATKISPVSKHQENMVGKTQAAVVKQSTSDAKPKRTKPTGSKNTISWGLPNSVNISPSVKIDKSKTNSREDTSQIAKSPPDNPWSKALVQSPPDKTYSFTDIVQDEEERVEILTKAINKPLGLIQIEEQAIQDLLGYYKANSAVDDYITVERVTKVAASPIWKRERLTSASWLD